MYNAPPSSCSVSASAVNHQRRHNVIVTDDTLVEKELGKQSAYSVDASRQSAESGNVTMTQRVSASVVDTADTDSSVGLPTSTGPFGSSEIYMEQTGNSETVGTPACDSLERGKAEPVVANVEVFDFISSSPRTEFVEASGEFANDGSEGGSEVNDNDGSVCGEVPRNNSTALPELNCEEKVGFEPDAITATEQWPAAVERKVRCLQTEVQRLLFDARGSGMKRELRTSGRVLGGVRRNTRRSPLLRLRTIVSSRPSSSSRHHNKLSSRVNGNRS